ncbi:MAG: cob(I)yrinic acid a,c-diamide adenosyltransferase [Vicinamibacterales bacterium]
MKIYTKTGDEGETSLFDNTRVSKADPRIDACGEVDELNAWLGVACAAGVSPPVRTLLEDVQRGLFALGARLADPSARIAARMDKATVTDADVARLERAIDDLEETLPPLRRFILPGGAATGAALHVARTVCRRAERRVVALGPGIEPVLVIYLNRLSDLLFVLARAVNHASGVPETEW